MFDFSKEQNTAKLLYGTLKPTQASSDAISKVNIKLNEKLGKHGFNAVKWLGSGSYGDAFLLSNGNVLKITKDKSEALSAATLKGKKLKNVYRVYNVFQFKDFKNWYFIECEKLNKMSGSLSNEASNMTTGNDDEELLNQERDDILPDPNWPKDAEDIGYGLYELKKLGIDFYDIHEGNVMMRGNDYVIIDIGQSRSPGARIDIYEALRNGWKIISYNQSYNILTVSKGGQQKEIENISPFQYEKIKQGKMNISKFINEGTKTIKKQITEKREISSILEKIIQQIYKTKDLNEAKTLMVEFINNSNIKDIDKKKMIQMVDTLKNIGAVQLYATNAMLKYEGMGTGYTEKNQRKLDVKESTKTEIKKSLKFLIESIIKI